MSILPFWCEGLYTSTVPPCHFGHSQPSSTVMVLPPILRPLPCELAQKKLRRYQIIFNILVLGSAIALVVLTLVHW